MRQPRVAVLTGMILAAAATRLLPHPPNFAPIAALALFGGAQFSSRRLAFVVPLGAMLLSDAVIGFHSGMPWVYGAFALIVGMGILLRSHLRVLPVAGAALAGSVLFFVVTNFGAWASGTMYPATAAGLSECYAAAIPFFRNTLAGDAVYTAVLFGGFALAQRRWPILADAAPAAA